MNCTTARDLIQPYLEGRLATLERNQFVYHVTECGACETDVIAYRDVFRCLDELPRLEAPSRLSVAVLAHLHAEGAIHEPRFPRVHRVIEGFLDLPAKLRYPLAAAIAIAVLYAPVAIVLSGWRGSLAGAAETFARAVLWAQGVLSSVPALGALEPYARTLRTVFHAAADLVSPVTMLGAAAFVIVVALSTARIIRRKRTSGHALFTI